MCACSIVSWRTVTKNDVTHHRIDIHFHTIKEEDGHKVRNFIEDTWAALARRGWVEMARMDEHVNGMQDFGFTFPARESHEATVLVEKLIRDHFMTLFVETVHSKKAKADG